MISVSIGIPTRNRLDSLSLCLLSIAMQTYKALEVIIVDDSDNPVNLTTIPIYKYIFQLLDDKGIKWKCIWGQRRGQHISHQIIQEIAEGDVVFRIDDDCVAEPNVLEELVKVFERGVPMAFDENHSEEYISPMVGAVAPLVLMPNAEELPQGLTNDIRYMNYPNVQWFKQSNPVIMQADHLYSCFMYRKGIAKYEMGLSKVSNREESLFTYSLKRSGYELLINGNARVHHFRMATGGIRSENDASLYEKDDAFFYAQLKLWGVNSNEEKMIVADMGMGDTWALKTALRDYNDTKQLVLAVCYPEVFFDFDKPIKLISIAQAQLLLKDITPFNLYKYCIDTDHKGNLVEALRKMYLQ